jgi:hypothetical protein
MTTTSPPETLQSATQEPLCPVAVPGKVRYGLMNLQGQYLVHAYKVEHGWSEWHTEPFDAIEWVDEDSVYAAAKVWLQIHNQPLVVVRL